MMLYPPMGDLVKKVGSPYELVNLVARRARELSNEAEASGEKLEQKPVSMAIQEVYESEPVSDETETED